MSVRDLCVVTEVRQADLALLERQLHSVINQRIGVAEWRLWSPDVDHAELAEFVDAALKLGQFASVAAQSDLESVLERLPYEYALILRGSDSLTPRAVPRINRELAAWGVVDLLYGDEIAMASTHEEMRPLFRPGWGPLLESNWGVVGDNPVIRIATLRRLGLPSGQFAFGDLAFRLHALGGRIHHVPSILVVRSEESPRRGTHFGQVSGVTRSRITVIIPTIGASPERDGGGVPLILQCLQSIERTITPSTDLEVLVIFDEGTPPHAIDRVNALSSPRVSVLHHDRPGAGFSYSAMANAGALAASGDVLIFLNDDVFIEEVHWAPLLSHWALLEGVGAAGASLLYPNGRVQHMGITTQLEGGGLPIHNNSGREADRTGHAGILASTREVHAVTGAILAVSRAAFLSVGGFSTSFPSDYNDVDLCWKLEAIGLHSVMVPSAIGNHLESATRSRSFSEADAKHLHARWGSAAYRDPWRNPNIAHEDFESMPDWGTWERGLPVRPKPNSSVFPDGKWEVWGSGEKRLAQIRMPRMLGCAPSEPRWGLQPNGADD